MAVANSDSIAPEMFPGIPNMTSTGAAGSVGAPRPPVPQHVLSDVLAASTDLTPITKTGNDDQSQYDPQASSVFGPGSYTDTGAGEGKTQVDAAEGMPDRHPESGQFVSRP